MKTAKLGFNFIASLTVVIILLVLCLAWFFQDEYYAGTIAPWQETKGWNQWKKMLPVGKSTVDLESGGPQIPIEEKPGIHLRNDDFSGKLLLKHKFAKEIYSYNPETKQISAATEEDWSKSTGKITICRYQIDPDFNTKTTYKWYPEYYVRYEGRNLKTYGSYGLRIIESPSHTRAAILSAYGPGRAPSHIGWIGIGGRDQVVYGTRYVQIIRLEDEKYLQDPVRINKNAVGKGEINFCWSDDEKYLVAYLSYESFSIIETGVGK